MLSLLFNNRRDVSVRERIHKNKVFFLNINLHLYYLSRAIVDGVNLNRNTIMNLQQIENLALELMNLDTLDINDKRLTLKDDSTNVTVAHAMAAKGYTFPLESELLKLVGTADWSVAHSMASIGYDFPEDSELLKLVDITGESVAHVMAKRGYQFSENSGILKLADFRGWTIAHTMAQQGYTFPIESELLKLVDDQGWTVAHVMADEGYQFPKGSELLKLVSKDIKGYEDDF